MNLSSTENFKPEPQPNSEQKEQEKHVSPDIGNTNVISSFEGSKFTKINDNISVGCISPEASDLLTKIMLAWEEHYATLIKNNPQYEPSHYGFAYWLVRWSGMVRPNNC